MRKGPANMRRRARGETHVFQGAKTLRPVGLHGDRMSRNRGARKGESKLTKWMKMDGAGRIGQSRDDKWLWWLKSVPGKLKRNDREQTLACTAALAV